MARLTRRRMYKKKAKGGAIGQFFNEVGSSLKGLVSRTRKKSAEIIDQGSSAVSGAIKGSETAVSNVNQNLRQKAYSTSNQAQTPRQQMIGGKKRRNYKSRKLRKSKKMRKSRKFKKH